MQAKEVLLSARSVLESINSPYCLYAYTNLLTVYAMEKDGDKVVELANVAEEKIKENHWEESDAAAALYGTIGYALILNGNEKAKQYFGYALNVLNKIGANNSIQYHSGLLFFGMSFFLDQSQTEEIIPLIVESYKNLYLSNAAYFNNSERESLIAGPRFSQTQNVLFSSRKDGGQDIQLYDFLLFNKGLLLGTSIGYAKAVYESGDEELISKYEMLLRLQRFLNGEVQLENEEISFDEAKVNISALEREITLSLRKTGNYTDGLNCVYSNVQNSLKNDELAIEFVSYLDYVDNTPYYAALVARNDWPAPRYIKLCKKEELEKVLALNPNLLYGETAASQNAYNLIWAPLASYLHDVKTIYFSPAGYINKLAIEHLYDGENRIGRKIDIVRLSSTRVICDKTTQYKYSSAVLYGGLKYDEDEETMISESRNIRGSNSSQPELFRGFDNNALRKGWDYLPGTLEEVNQITSIITKAKINCDVYKSEKGNEESFKALSGRNFGILHVATHGFYMTERQAKDNDYFALNPFTSQRPGIEISSLQRSGLLLSGANRAWKGDEIPDGIEDGILTASEIASLNFNSCDVVVLSACETGLGEITDEGVFGLQRAFKNAGVNTIIMSLWEVDDFATSLMMQTFYRNLIRGNSKREAFSVAQEEVRKKFDDPRYWAAFIMLD